MGDSQAHEEDRLAELLAGYDEALAGATELPADPAACAGDLQAWPAGQSRRLEEDLACLRLLDQLRPNGPCGAPPAFEPETLPPPRALLEDEEARYALERLHATGGIGHVWLAWDSDLGREVALKELRPERIADPALLARFLHEARITGRLQHPGIVPVYELVADADGPPFYTMRLVRGRTLTDAVRDHHQRLVAEGRPDSLGLIRLLNAFVNVCHTMAYAHSQGVIHRDLKGQNIILGDFGEVIVLDWGFAREIHHPDEPTRGPGTDPHADSGPAPSLSETLAGQLLGTPAYMAPEQAEGRLDGIDERTDVFGLGACLYEILTGQPPFISTDTAEVLRKARATEVRLPRAVCPRVSPSLAAVCIRAMAHRPADRYATPADLAREIQRWLADEPTEAYPEAALGRLLRWSRHHKPALAVLAAIAFTTALASGVGLALVGEARSRASQAVARMQEERAEARAAADRAVQRRLEEQLYFQRVALAERELADSNIGRAAELLAACPDRFRGWEWNYLKRRIVTEPRVLRGHKGAVSGIALSPDGRLLASSGHDHLVRLWDRATGAPAGTLTGHTDVAYDVAFSPGGRLLASASWDGTVKLWDFSTRREVASWNAHHAKVYRIAFSPDGQRLASVGSDDSVILTEVASGRRLGSWQMPKGLSLWRAAFSPDDRVLAITTYEGIYFLDPLTAGQVLRHLKVESRYVKCLAFSPDGKLLATGEGDLAASDTGRIQLWDVATGERLGELEGHPEPIFGLAFSPDGSRLFSVSQDRTARVWDLSTRQEALTLRGHTDTVRGLVLDPSGHLLATSSSDGTVRLWDATPAERSGPELLHTLTGHAEPVFSVAFGADGRTAFSLDLGLGLREWDVEGGVEKRFVSLHQDRRGYSLAASADGRQVAVATNAGKIYLINPLPVPAPDGTGRVSQILTSHDPGPIKGLAFSPDGTAIASAGWDRTVRITTLRDHQVLVLRGHDEAVLAVAWSPDGRYLASAGYDGTVGIWNARTGARLQTLAGHTARVNGVAFSRSGRLLASAGHDGTVRVWETGTWKLHLLLRGHTAGVDAVDFGPGSKPGSSGPPDGYLASASQDRTVKVWDSSLGREVSAYRGHTGGVHAVAFSPDGRRLVSGGHDKVVRVWTFERQ
jgi:WD40 repeat protein/serine/threonine protein kinase